MKTLYNSNVKPYRSLYFYVLEIPQHAFLRKIKAGFNKDETK